MIIRPLILSLLLTQSAHCTLLHLTEVTLPLYLHGADTDPIISFEPVPFVTFHSDPEWRFSAISTPFVPPTDGTWERLDVNLASLYGVTVSGTYDEQGKGVLVSIDASNAHIPDGYPFTIDQVIDAITTCVKVMYPHRPPENGALNIEVTRPQSTRHTSTAEQD